MVPRYKRSEYLLHRVDLAHLGFDDLVGQMNRGLGLTTVHLGLRHRHSALVMVNHPGKEEPARFHTLRLSQCVELLLGHHPHRLVHPLVHRLIQ